MFLLFSCSEQAYKHSRLQMWNVSERKRRKIIESKYFHFHFADAAKDSWIDRSCRFTREFTPVNMFAVFNWANPLLTQFKPGERPHVCHICPQTFIHQTDLRRHIWGHTGERPYKCSYPNCGKGFMKRSELINHENRCHPPVQQQQPLPYQHYAM